MSPPNGRVTKLRRPNIDAQSVARPCAQPNPALGDMNQLTRIALTRSARPNVEK